MLKTNIGECKKISKEQIKGGAQGKQTEDSFDAKLD